MLRGLVPSLVLAAALALATPSSAHAQPQAWGFDWIGRIEHDAEGLAADDPDVRRAAVESLRGYDPSLTKAFLLPALRDPSIDVQLAAARALGAGAVAEAASPLIEWLADPDVRLRAAAAEALGPIGTDRGTAALVRTLGDTEAAVRAKAVLALGAIGQRGDRSVVVPLLSRLGDEKIEVRRSAIEQLRAIGDRRAVVPLVGAFADNSQDVRKAAVQAVGRLGDRAAVPALLRLLADPSLEVRALAIAALGELGAVEAVDELVAILVAGGELAPRAAFALGQVARRGDPEASSLAVQALVAALADASQRAAAIEGLRTAGAGAVAPLVAHLDGRLPGDPRSAVELLAELGDARATDALIAELERGRVAVATVVAALARTGDPRALVPVLRLVAADDATIRLAAMTAVGPLLGSDPRAADAIVERLGDDDEEIRVLATEYLGQIRARVAVGPLMALTGAAAPERLRRAAIDALGEIGDPAAVPTLITAVRDGAETVQQAAADALGAIAAPDSAAALAKLVAQMRGPGRHHAVRAWGAVLRSRPDATARTQLIALAERAPPPVALAAIAALAAQGDAAATPALIAIADGGTPDRQRAALWALGELGGARAIAPLVAGLASKDDRVAAAAAWALGDVARDPAQRPAVATAAGATLRRLARRGGWATAIDATAALGRIGVADGAGDLAQLVFHRSPLVRANAAWALGRLAEAGVPLPPTTVAALARQVVDDTSTLARRAAAGALGRVRDRGDAATAVLRQVAQHDREAPVRDEASAALAPTRAPAVARDEWRVFYVVDASAGDRAVKEEPYVVIGADGVAWATYTDLRGHVTAEHFPAGEATVVTAGAEAGL